jgi:predicted transcriptional regulator
MKPRRRRVPSRGGRQGWEPVARVRARTVRAVALTVQGWSQHDIAQELGVSQAAVSKMLARADARSFRELITQIERQKVRQTQRLEYLFRELMRAWTQSQTDATRRRQRQTTSTGGGGSAQSFELTVATQHGDPRYVEEMRKVLADLRKLWGLDAPQRLDVRATATPFDGLDDHALLARLADQDAQLRRLGLIVDVPPQTPATSEKP